MLALWACPSLGHMIMSSAWVFRGAQPGCGSLDWKGPRRKHSNDFVSSKTRGVTASGFWGLSAGWRDTRNQTTSLLFPVLLYLLQGRKQAYVFPSESTAVLQGTRLHVIGWISRESHQGGTQKVNTNHLANCRSPLKSWSLDFLSSCIIFFSRHSLDNATMIYLTLGECSWKMSANLLDLCKWCAYPSAWQKARWVNASNRLMELSRKMWQIPVWHLSTPMWNVWVCIPVKYAGR